MLFRIGKEEYHRIHCFKMKSISRSYALKKKQLSVILQCKTKAIDELNKSIVDLKDHLASLPEIESEIQVEGDIGKNRFTELNIADSVLLINLLIGCMYSYFAFIRTTSNYFNRSVDLEITAYLSLLFPGTCYYILHYNPKEMNLGMILGIGFGMIFMFLMSSIYWANMSKCSIKINVIGYDCYNIPNMNIISILSYVLCFNQVSITSFIIYFNIVNLLFKYLYTVLHICVITS